MCSANACMLSMVLVRGWASNACMLSMVLVRGWAPNACMLSMVLVRGWASQLNMCWLSECTPVVVRFLVGHCTYCNAGSLCALLRLAQTEPQLQVSFTAVLRHPNLVMYMGLCFLSRGASAGVNNGCSATPKRGHVHGPVFLKPGCKRRCQ